MNFEVKIKVHCHVRFQFLLLTFSKFSREYKNLFYSEMLLSTNDDSFVGRNLNNKNGSGNRTYVNKLP